MKLQKLIGKLLMTFLLVSIGVAFGKELAVRNAPSPVEPAVSAGQTKTIVYYMHGIPCITCTFVEMTAEAVVHENFSKAVEDGRMEFISLNYLDAANAALADRYKVGENMVIAVHFADGKEVDRIRLDKVMSLASDVEKLKEYLRNGIESALKGGKQ